jgi:uncharacterized membrane protein YcaP (DUF421 family)
MEIVVRATLLFWVIWLITRGMGKRELAEMSPFELVVLVVMGDLIQQGVTQEDFSVVGAATAVGVFAAWALVLSVLSNRFDLARRAFDGQPVIVVRDGAFCIDAMRAERILEDDVREAARDRGIASIALVEVGILEPDGGFSFIRTDDRGLDPPPSHEV